VASPPTPPALIKHLLFVAAVLLAAEHPAASISELVMVYRLNGLGGDRACRKLIHRLQRLDLLEIRVGERVDRREKSLHLAAAGRELLRVLRQHLHAIDP